MTFEKKNDNRILSLSRMCEATKYPRNTAQTPPVLQIGRQKQTRHNPPLLQKGGTVRIRSPDILVSKRFDRARPLSENRNVALCTCDRIIMNFEKKNDNHILPKECAKPSTILGILRNLLRCSKPNALRIHYENQLQLSSLFCEEARSELQTESGDRSTVNTTY